MTTRSQSTGVVIVGAGPAGLSSLFAAANEGRLNELLELGVTILEQGMTVGRGFIGNYAIHSDSAAEAFLDIVLRSKEPRLQALAGHPATKALTAFEKGAVPLRLVGDFLEVAGTALCRAVSESKRGRVITGATALRVQQDAGGLWWTRFRMEATGTVHEIQSVCVVMSTGAHQPHERLLLENVAGQPLLPKYQGKVLQSGEALTEGGLAEVRRRLADKADPKVAIVGGSSSAAATAQILLSEVMSLPFRENGVTLLHQQPLRVFYETVQAALNEGYTEFKPDDVCPITGRVFRLSGFRFDSRELIMKARGLSGRSGEPRLRLLHLKDENFPEAQQVLEEADIVIAALGYKPRLLPAFDSTMQGIRILSPSRDRWSVVDPYCRLVTEDGLPIKGLFAVGLAVGPAATKELGGEANYRGQVNSLWMWQHTLGLRIAEQVLAECRDCAHLQSEEHSVWPDRTAVCENHRSAAYEPSENAGSAR